MSRRKCCCPCWSWADDFLPEQFAPDWNAVVGTWSFAANKIHVDNTANAVLIMENQPPRTPQHHRVNIVAFEPAAGDKPRIILNYQDSNNYFFAEYAVGGDLYLYRRAGGTNTLLASCTPIDTFLGTFTAGMTDQYFYASFSGAFAMLEEQGEYLYACDPARFPNTSLAGYGNGGGAALDFDKDFLIDEVWPTKRNCPQTICTCDGYCIPKTLLLTSTVVGDCPRAGGLSVTLTRDDCKLTWKGSAVWCYPNDPPEEFEFTCASGGSAGFTLGASLSISGTLSSIDEICNPLSITFELDIDGGPDPDPYQGSPCCDQYGDVATVTFTVTESP